MEDHNGSIAAKNSSDGGAIFTITLPRVELAIEEK
jgi:signal transduction histidine kinase